MTLFLAIFLSSISAFALSLLINFLYSLPNAPLTFPNKKHNLLIRYALLCIILYFTFLYFQSLYQITFILFLLIITVTDFEQYIIFDVILIPFALLGIFFNFVFDLPFLERILSAFIAGTVFFSLMILTKNGIGGGDVKLVATLGLWLGADKLISTILCASFLGGICALLLLLSGVKKRTDYFAYGPYFCIAAAVHFLLDFKL